MNNQRLILISAIVLLLTLFIILIFLSLKKDHRDNFSQGYYQNFYLGITKGKYFTFQVSEVLPLIHGPEFSQKYFDPTKPLNKSEMPVANVQLHGKFPSGEKGTLTWNGHPGSWERVYGEDYSFKLHLPDGVASQDLVIMTEFDLDRAICSFSDLFRFFNQNLHNGKFLCDTPN